MTPESKYSQIGQLLLSHFKEIIREPGVSFWGIVFPMLMSLGLGLAFTQKQDMVRKVAVLSDGDTAWTDSLLTNFLSAGTNADGGRVYQMEIKKEQTGKKSFRYFPMGREEAMAAHK